MMAPATGGSIVCGARAMHYLVDDGIVAPLDLPFDQIERRVTNLYTRGVVMEKGQTLRGLYDKCQPLYKKFADLTIDCSAKTYEQIVEEIISSLDRCQ